MAGHGGRRDARLLLALLPVGVVVGVVLAAVAAQEAPGRVLGEHDGFAAAAACGGGGGECEAAVALQELQLQEQDAEAAAQGAFVLLQTALLHPSRRPPSAAGGATAAAPESGAAGATAGSASAAPGSAGSSRGGATAAAAGQRAVAPDSAARLAEPAAAAAAAVAAGSPEQPRGISQAFVHLFEWSWDDVANECESFLGPKGFTAVLISPPNEHITGDGWYTRYQPVSYKLVSRSGNEAQFADMVKRCRSAGVGIYADAVFNHCAAMGGTGVAGSRFGNRTYPMYTPEDFHHVPGDTTRNCGVENYQDKGDVQNCDLVGMPDLCTGCEHVQEVVADYINRMADLGIAGFRIDAAKHMDAGELKQLLSKVNPKLYMFQEVLASPGEAVQATSYYVDGPVTEFGFAATLVPKFMGKDLLRDDLAKFGEGWGLAPSDRAVVFTDNHDSQRSGSAPLTYKSGELYTLVNVFMLAYPYGYPKVMSSYAFETGKEGPPAAPVHGPGGAVHCGPGQPWVCEHRRPAIANMVAWRRTAGNATLRDWVASGSTLSFCRGRLACAAFNVQSEPWDARLSVSLPAGDYCDVIRSSSAADCPTVRVDADGVAVVRVPPSGAVAFHAGAARKVVASDSSASAEDAEDMDMEDSLPLK